MQTLTKLQLSNLSIFSPRTQRIQTTIFKDLFRKEYKKQKKSSVHKKQRKNNYTLPHKFKYPFKNHYDDSSPLYQCDTPTKKYLKPLRNAIAKIVELRRQQLPRRKSAHGEFFGELTQKEMSNLPTIVNQHKEVNKQELALASFAIMLERKQKRSTTRKLSRKLTRQESTFVEYDNMERPPTEVTPPKLNLIPKQKPKSKIQLEKEKYFKSQDLKMGHFLTGRLQKQTIIQTKNIPNSESFKFPSNKHSFNSLPNINTFISSPKVLPILKQSSLANIQEPNQIIKTTRQRPYTKHNILLLKKIQQTFEFKNISSSTQKQNSIDRKHF